MSSRSAIEWLKGGSTWNVVRGCSRGGTSGPPCRASCYAEKMARRLSGPGKPYEGLTVLTEDGPAWNGKVRCVPELLTQPVRWRKSRLVFPVSMGDLFHEAVPFDFLDQVFGVMAACRFGRGGGPGHVFIVTTKRAARMREYLSRDRRDEWARWGARLGGGEDPDPMHDQIRFGPSVLPHVWLGVSIEDQAAADARVPELLATPAAVRWVSAEPLLGPVNLRRFPFGEGGRTIDALTGRLSPHPITGASSREPVTGQLHWIVGGGETGFAARPCHPEWARSLREQARDAGVPFFWKAWGEWSPDGKRETAYRLRADAGTVVDLTIKTKSGHPTSYTVAVPSDANDNAGPVEVLLRLGKRKSGRLLDGKFHDAMPEVP